jgi:hypothetical protein
LRLPSIILTRFCPILFAPVFAHVFARVFARVFAPVFARVFARVFALGSRSDSPSHVLTFPFSSLTPDS